MKDERVSLYHYRGVIPQILAYQLVSKSIFLVMMFFYQQLTGLLLWHLDRPAFTSGDLPYLMRSWEGWGLILLGFVALVLYTVFDIFATILISDRLLHKKKLKARPMLLEAFGKLRYFKSPQGILVILYVSLFAPLAGAAFGISLTTDFAVPEFILSVIQGNLILKLLYNLAVTALGIVGTVYIFTFHFVIHGNMDVKLAMKKSRLIMKAHWKHFLAQYFLFIAKGLLILLLLFALLYLLPIVVLQALPLSEYAYHTGIIFSSYLILAMGAVTGLVFLYFLMMKLTVLYRNYLGDEGVAYQIPDKQKKKKFVLAIIAVLAVLLAVSFGLASDFDGNFPAASKAAVIAHRGGGTLANENTLLSLEAAIEHHAAASEIDVQRTADGYYIINHDTDFSRCCGVKKKPGEMTLAQIKDLEVINAWNPLAPTTEVATMEEMLDAAKGRLQLYIELKGESADSQMAEDIYAMVSERDMLDECAFISLDYEIINEIETKHPDARTGYLCYFSFGNIADMNCDMLLLEAETATKSNIDKIHGAGEADGIITDEVLQAEIVGRLLENRDDVARVMQKIVG